MKPPPCGPAVCSTRRSPPRMTMPKGTRTSFASELNSPLPPGSAGCSSKPQLKGDPLYIVWHPEPDVVLTRQLTLSLRRKQDLLERLPLVRRQQSGVDHCHLSLQLDSAAIMALRLPAWHARGPSLRQPEIGSSGPTGWPARCRTHPEQHREVGSPKRPWQPLCQPSRQRKTLDVPSATH